jgi:hypothetical protein
MMTDYLVESVAVSLLGEAMITLYKARPTIKSASSTQLSGSIVRRIHVRGWSAKLTLYDPVSAEKMVKSVIIIMPMIARKLFSSNPHTAVLLNKKSRLTNTTSIPPNKEGQKYVRVVGG